MNLRFAPEDESGFAKAREWLLEGFARWLRAERGLSEPDALTTALDAGVALDWKWRYADGDLASWRADELAELLFEWCPRNLSISPAQSCVILQAVARFLEFLSFEGMLAAGSTAVDEFAGSLPATTVEFVRAMGESSNFALAKSLFAAASGDGVDVTDPQQFERWMAEFNSGPEDDRRQLVADSAIPAGVLRRARPSFPPVALPSDEAIEASRADAPVLDKMARLASFVGDGRPLTKTGNLTLADGRALVELLATGDRVEEKYGGRTIVIRSSAELTELSQLFRWAKRAGVLRVSHGKVIATRLGRTLGRDQGRQFDRVLDALLHLGPIESMRPPHAWEAFREVGDFLDESVAVLLAAPYVSPHPLAFAELAEIASEAVLSAFEFGPGTTPERVARVVSYRVSQIVDSLELAGAMRRADTELDQSGFVPRRSGGTVELTPAGVAATRRLLQEAGYEVPAAGRSSQASAVELILGTETADELEFLAELGAWRAGRDPLQVISELADAVRAIADPALRTRALSAMSESGVELAEPFVRQLATEPATRGFALCWAVERGLEEPTCLFDPGDLVTFVDVLAHHLVLSGADEFIEVLSLAGNHAQQVKAIAGMWRSPSAATEPVLVAIGAVHPARAVAKAARKAVLQRRSWLASR